MACPALPLCGLAVTEAERGLPDVNRRIRALLTRLGMADEQLVIRMTGCPNGCSRPYMAELGFVGDGPNSYQVCVRVCVVGGLAARASVWRMGRLACGATAKLGRLEAAACAIG